jgi:hypothetical protein
LFHEKTPPRSQRPLWEILRHGTPCSISTYAIDHHRELRLTATCLDPAAADQLSQSTMATAPERLYGIAW